MIENYKNTVEVFETSILYNYKDEMLDYENSLASDYISTDITLTSINSSAEKKIENFWFSMGVQITLVDKKSKEVEPHDTSYYVKTTMERISLYYDQMDEPFSEIWGTPPELEEELLVAIFKDMILLDEKCLQGLTGDLLSKLINEGYLSVEQFSDETKVFYFDLFGIENMLDRDVQEVFLF